MALKDVKFADLYLSDDESWMTGKELDSSPLPINSEYAEEVKTVLGICNDKMKNSGLEEFSFVHDTISYRGSYLKSQKGTVFVLRKLPSTVPNLEDLCLQDSVISAVMNEELTGLVLIAGAYGNGKTTTASAIVKARLQKFGGVAVTIEEPTEMPLEGSHGNGLCYQTSVENGDWYESMRKTARYAPDIIYLGELRDSETAREALRASINGVYVIATIHADDVTSAIERLHSLCLGHTGGKEETGSLLANGLACVLHQKLLAEGGQRVPSVECLRVKEAENSPTVKTLIKQHEFSRIQSEIRYQLNSISY